MKPVQESTDVKGKPRRKERAFNNKSRLYSSKGRMLALKKYASKIAAGRLSWCVQRSEMYDHMFYRKLHWLRRD